MKLLRKFRKWNTYLNLFSTPMDALKFNKLYNEKNSNKRGEIISLKVKETLNHPIYLRPNTSDSQVLLDTFQMKYHISPVTLKKGSCVLDLGAYVGYTMVHFAYLYPNSKIFGVELDYDNFQLAKKNLAALTEFCKIINAAVWSKNGTVIYGGDNTCGFSIFKEGSQNNSKKISSKTLDVIMDEFGLDLVDYLKVDIEGAEKAILENPEKWISKIRSMKIEVHPPATIDWCIEILKKYDFKCSKDLIHPNAIIATNNKI